MKSKIVFSLSIDGLIDSLFFLMDIEYFFLFFRILHSTFDIDITHCIQVILCSPRLLPVGYSDRLDMLMSFH